MSYPTYEDEERAAYRESPEYHDEPEICQRCKAVLSQDDDEVVERKGEYYHYDCICAFDIEEEIYDFLDDVRRDTMMKADELRHEIKRLGNAPRGKIDTLMDRLHAVYMAAEEK